MALGTLAGDIDFLNYYLKHKPTGLDERDELQRALYRLIDTVQNLPVNDDLNSYKEKTAQLCRATLLSLKDEPQPTILSNTEETLNAISTLFRYYRDARIKSATKQKTSTKPSMWSRLFGRKAIVGTLAAAAITTGSLGATRQNYEPPAPHMIESTVTSPKFEDERPAHTLELPKESTRAAPITPSLTSTARALTPAEKLTLDSTVTRVRHLLEFTVEQAQSARLDPALILAQITQESAGDSVAKSETGALGISQFTSNTAPIYFESLADRRDPHKSIRAQIEYMKDLKKRFSRYADSDQLALAAYNGGPTMLDGVLDVLRREDKPIKWTNVVGAIIDSHTIEIGSGENGRTYTFKVDKKREIIEYVDKILAYRAQWRKILDNSDPAQLIVASR